MIDVKSAVRNAVEFVQSVLEKEKYDKITLEEVELSEDSRFWYITLSLGKLIVENPFDTLMSGDSGKLSVKYKVFTVDRETGDVLTMKIRKND